MTINKKKIIIIIELVICGGGGGGGGGGGALWGQRVFGAKSETCGKGGSTKSPDRSTKKLS